LNIRVIGGVYGGRKLDAPDGRTTHPMGERIRNALFNSLGNDIVGAAVLDAFAGTGAVGIEALSRGATSAVFVEKDKIAQKCIINNLQSLQIEQGQLVKTTVNNWLETYSGESFDIIFADPPYYDTQENVVARLITLLAPGGTFVLSWPEHQPAPELLGAAVVFERVYAGARIVMYKNTK
jgi:16S rRNA (guanine966-N2)-methyltransferase